MYSHAVVVASLLLCAAVSAEVIEIQIGVPCDPAEAQSTEPELIADMSGFDSDSPCPGHMYPLTATRPPSAASGTVADPLCGVGGQFTLGDGFGHTLERNTLASFSLGLPAMYVTLDCNASQFYVGYFLPGVQVYAGNLVPMTCGAGHQIDHIYFCVQPMLASEVSATLQIVQHAVWSAQLTSDPHTGTGMTGASISGNYFMSANSTGDDFTDFDIVVVGTAVLYLPSYATAECPLPLEWPMLSATAWIKISDDFAGSHEVSLAGTTISAEDSVTVPFEVTVFSTLGLGHNMQQQQQQQFLGRVAPLLGATTAEFAMIAQALTNLVHPTITYVSTDAGVGCILGYDGCARTWAYPPSAPIPSDNSVQLGCFSMSNPADTTWEVVTDRTVADAYFVQTDCSTGGWLADPMLAFSSLVPDIAVAIRLEPFEYSLVGAGPWMFCATLFVVEHGYGMATPYVSVTDELLVSPVSVPTIGCVNGMGYWKTHSGAPRQGRKDVAAVLLDDEDDDGGMMLVLGPLVNVPTCGAFAGVVSEAVDLPSQCRAVYESYVYYGSATPMPRTLQAFASSDPAVYADAHDLLAASYFEANVFRSGTCTRTRLVQQLATAELNLYRIKLQGTPYLPNWTVGSASDVVTAMFDAHRILSLHTCQSWSATSTEYPAGAVTCPSGVVAATGTWCDGTHVTVAKRALAVHNLISSWNEGWFGQYGFQPACSN